MDGPMDDAARIVPNPRAVYRKLADGAGGVVLHLDTAAYHGVNETGAYNDGIVADMRQAIDAYKATVAF